MRNQVHIESLNAELIAKNAMLAELECGDVSHGCSFESRGLGVRQRVLRIRAELRELRVRDGEVAFDPPPHGSR
jgi:hypothetical protein